MNTIKAFISKSHLSAKLIRSTIKQIGNYEYFKSVAPDVTNYGAQGGFCGFTYYSDTLAFTKRNKKEILSLCEEMDQQIESVGILAFIASFNCLKGIDQDSIARAIYQGKGDDVTQVLNALAWFALEEISRNYSDLVYEAE